jgi:hypothetical protein
MILLGHSRRHKHPMMLTFTHLFIWEEIEYKSAVISKKSTIKKSNIYMGYFEGSKCKLLVHLI